MTQNEQDKKISYIRIAVRYMILAVICVVIFWFSSNNGDSSTSQSDFVVNKIISVFFPHFDSYQQSFQTDLKNTIAVIVRKSAHFLIYTALGGFAFAAFFQIKSYGVRYILSVFFTFVYACTDEIHQLFVPGRTGRITDVFIDTSGGAIGAFVVFAIIAAVTCSIEVTKHRKSIKNNNSV